MDNRRIEMKSLHATLDKKFMITTHAYGQNGFDLSQNNEGNKRSGDGKMQPMFKNLPTNVKFKSARLEECVTSIWNLANPVAMYLIPMFIMVHKTMDYLAMVNRLSVLEIVLRITQLDQKIVGQLMVKLLD